MRDNLPVFSAGGHHEQFSHRQGPNFVRTISLQKRLIIFVKKTICFCVFRSFVRTPAVSLLYFFLYIAFWGY